MVRMGGTGQPASLWRQRPFRFVILVAKGNKSPTAQVSTFSRQGHPALSRMATFEETLIPLLPSAYNLARWIVRNEHDAEDCVQDAYLRAFKVFDRFRGGDGRAWLLTIVRNVCYSRLRRRTAGVEDSFDETLHGIEPEAAATSDRLRVEVGAELLQNAMEAIPEAMREVIVLHDLEGLAYKDIAEVVGVPLGTVMSRLARARKHLQRELISRLEKEVGHGG